MSTRSHSTFVPKFEGRTRDALVVRMTGNVVCIRIKRKKRRPALSSTAVLVSGRA